MLYRGKEIHTFVDLLEVIDSLNTTEEEKKEARKELEEAMDDFC